MTSQIILHETTKQHIEQLKEKVPHALLITGVQGSGKTYVAQYILSTLFDIPLQSVGAYQYGTTISAAGTSISIDQIRQLVQHMSLKTTGKRSLRRFALIEHADLMTVEAQNALLKVLEEPPQDTIIILTANNLHDLLPTVCSRCQQLAVKRTNKQDALAYLQDTYPAAKNLEQSYALSGGNIGLLCALLSDNTDHPLLEAVTWAKEILRASTFERLAQVDTVAKKKDSLSAYLFALQQVAHAGLRQAAAKNNDIQIRKWHGIVQSVSDAQNAIASSGQAKVQLTKLFLSL